MEPKNRQQLKQMEEGGNILAEVMLETVKNAKEGVKVSDLDKFASDKIISLGAKPSFPLVPGYKWATCMCVNDVVVHGIPTDYKLKLTDILGIDMGVYLHGFHTDMSWTIQITDNSKQINRLRQDFGGQAENRFLKIGQKALVKAIEQVRTGNMVGHVSQAIQNVIEKEGGCSVVRQLVGHGVGRELHEDPYIPGILSKPISKTPELLENQTLAIEVIYAKGKGEIAYKNDDGWTIVTKDGSLSGLFETTVAVGKNGPVVITPFTGLLNSQV
ncbi:MAG: type I methionyl aminopeptidase [Patescibacteria group bacterium]|nr:type I methionyl aminopeptidase [Patescibacteria group bacterium]